MNDYDHIIAKLDEFNANLFNHKMDEIREMTYQTEFSVSDLTILASLAIRTLRRRHRITSKVTNLLTSFQTADSRETVIYQNRSKAQHLKADKPYNPDAHQQTIMDEQPPDFYDIPADPEIPQNVLTHLRR